MKVEDLLHNNEKKDLGIRVPDDWRSVSYAVDNFAIPPHYSKYLECVLLPRGLVLDRTEKLGKTFLSIRNILTVLMDLIISHIIVPLNGQSKQTISVPKKYRKNNHLF